jgi:hypothetical protein
MRRPGRDAIAASGPTARDWGARVFVWGVWAAMSLALVFFVRTLRSEYPSQDEWEFIPEMTARQPITLGRLWSQHNEHRMPLPRLILVGVGRLSGCNCRTAATVEAGIMVGLAAFLIHAARRLRGGTAYADAFFPLALLHWAHYEILFNTAALQFLLSSALSAVLLLLILLRPGGPTRRTAALAGACLLALPLCGANGLPVAVAGALWLGACGARAWRSPEPEGRRAGAVSVALALAAILLVAFYFHGYQRPANHPPAPGLRAWLATSLRCLSTSCLPWLPWARTVCLLAVPALLLLTGALLARVAWRRAGERPRVAGLSLFLGAFMGMTFLMGWGRAAFGPEAGLVSRYALTTAPVLLAVYLAWCVYGSAPAAGLVQTGLFTVACLSLQPRMAQGWEYARGVDFHMREFRRDLRAGTPVAAMAEHFAYLTGVDERHVASRLRLLRDEQVGPYRRLTEGLPPCDEVLLPPRPARTHQMDGDAAVWTGTGDDPYLVFTLPEARFVRAVRLRYRLSGEQGATAASEVYWSRRDGETFTILERHRRCRLPVGPEWRTHTVWVNDVVKDLRLDPDGRPCRFEIAEMMLFVPPSESAEGNRVTTR